MRRMMMSVGGGAGGGGNTWPTPRVAAQYAPIGGFTTPGSATRLQDGRVLVVGGLSGFSGPPTNGTWIISENGTVIQSTNFPSSIIYAGITTLSDGRVLVCGGAVSVDLYVTSSWLGTVTGNTISWVVASAFPLAVGMKLVTLSDGRVAATVMGDGFTTLQRIDIGTVSGNTVSWVTSNSPTTKTYTAGWLSLGSKLVIAETANLPISSGPLSGNTFTWTAGPAMSPADVSAPLMCSFGQNLMGFWTDVGGNNWFIKQFNGTAWVDQFSFARATFPGYIVEIGNSGSLLIATGGLVVGDNLVYIVRQ